MMEVKRETHPVNQESVDYFDCTYVSCPTYASVTGTAMLELRLEPDHVGMWRSNDNGETWTIQERLPLEEKVADGSYVRYRHGPFFLDPDLDILLMFSIETDYKGSLANLRNESAQNIYKIFINNMVKNSQRVFYRISSDAGVTWSDKKQLIEKGPEYDETHWAENVTYLKNHMIPTVPPFHKLPDGRIAIHNQGKTSLDADKFGTLQPGRFFGRWNSDASDLEWESGGIIPGGGCEQATAILKDGRILSVIRSQGQIEPYYFDNWLRAYSTSEDGGETWKKPQILKFSDGTGFTSPRGWSQLIRSEKNGKLYWIANILPPLEETAELRAEFKYRADPRYPIQIVEVDEECVALKKETLTVIDDRAPDESKWVRFSNFDTYNDRVTGEIVVLLKKCYCELEENMKELEHPAYRYRISV